MKTVVLIASIAAAISVGPVAAGTSSSQDFKKPAEQIQHGGGCRKDSPRGQCCHAGSKPYHCH